MHAFIWVGLGVATGSFFVVATAVGGQPVTGSVAIGLGIIGLAVVSGVLEYLALPGARVVLDADQMVVQPRRGDAVVLPLEYLGRLQIDPPQVGAARPLFGQVVGEREIPGRQPRSFAEAGIRGRRTGPTWRLTAHPRPGAASLPGHGRAIPVGIDDAKLAALRAACNEFGVLLSAPD